MTDGISEVDKAYAAGLIDGEGCISAGGKWNNYHIEVEVAMVDEAAVKWLGATFCGRAYTQYGNKWKGGCLFRWRIPCKRALDFLVMIYPYLKIKRPQARAAIDLALLAHNRVNRKLALRDSELESRKELAVFIRKKNQRELVEAY